MDLCLIAMTMEVEKVLNNALAVGMVMAGLGFVIFVHELGHFLAAKACGVKAEKFYVGFDIPMPKIFGWQIPSKLAKFQWGETEYGIGILPLGGYVKMLGQDDDPRRYKEEQSRAKGDATPVTGDDTAAAVMHPVEPVPPDHAKFDPRSYQAKSVPQRMLIISAGVIMNLIFAVIMGAVAYKLGVPYTPTVIGDVPAGTSGWTEGLQPGDKVIRLSEHGRVSEQFRWQQDLIPQVLLKSSAPVKLLIQRPGVEEPFEVAVQGVKRPDAKFALLGIQSAGTTTIGAISEVERSGAARAKDLKVGDKIVAIDGESIESYRQLQALLALRPDKTLALKVERTEKQEKTSTDQKPKVTEHDVELPPQPLRTLGLVMKVGPISSVRKNSPADVPTGIMAGDELISINGEPVGDPFTLSQRLLPLIGKKDVPIEVQRTDKDGKKSKLTRKITPAEPVFMEDGAEPLGGDQIGLEPLGISLPVLFEVADVEKGGPADKAGLRPGDKLEGVQFISTDEAYAEKLKDKKLDKQFTLHIDGRNWAFFYNLLQELPESVDVSLTVLRDGKLVTERVTPIDATEGYFEPRGFDFMPMREIRTAASTSEAVALGFRETTDKLKEVAATLGAFVTGKISFSGAAGPLGIVEVAYMEASEGWGRLLIFLTFLSANLALINFLPIPVLDGGHMAFLAWEGIRGKPVSENIQYYALLTGAAMLLCLMVFVFGNDIFRIVERNI